jgi:hypothetical protein
VSIVASGMRRAGEAVPPPVQAPQIQSAPQHMPPAGLPPQGAITNAMPPLYSNHAVPPAPPGAIAPQSMPMAMPAPAGAPAHEEMHRRLTEAFNVPAPPLPPQQHQPSSKQATEPGRESWASGNVMIEDGFTPFAHQGARQPNPYTAPTVSSAEPPPAPRGFEPAAPADIRRQPRRMPALEDLPAVGQREWQARQGNSGAPVQPAEEGRKRGLFDRLTGLGRRQDGRSAEDTPTDDMQEEAKLPVFFGNQRR